MKNRFLIALSIFAILSLISIDKGWGEDAYEFERMQPTTYLPWSFYSPSGIDVDRIRGFIYVADTWNSRVLKFGGGGEFITTWSGSGEPGGEFVLTSEVAVNGDGDVYVIDCGNDRVQKFDMNGNYLLKWGEPGVGDGQFHLHTFATSVITGVAVDQSGVVYVADTGNHRIQKFDADGRFLMKWGSEGGGEGEFSHPTSLATDAGGYVYVADSGNHRVQKFDANGVFIQAWGEKGDDDGKLNTPQRVEVDPVVLATQELPL